MPIEHDESARPTLGFWLGLLAFCFGVSPFWISAMIFRSIAYTEQHNPQLTEIPSWQTFKLISAAFCIAVVFAVIVGVHGIFAGKKHVHLERILMALWFITLGRYVLNFTFIAKVSGLAVAWSALTTVPAATLLVGFLIHAPLWTIYLTTSDRCRRRYPRITP
jgi:hypothetical protein